jgi:AGZA family xanthine/uracil permease-like MFS transporter
MMRQVTSVNWGYIGDALPAFVTIVSMPFCYSVAYGLIAGCSRMWFEWWDLCYAEGEPGWCWAEEIEPPDADKGEYWTYKVGGSSPPVSLLLSLF